jgi:hypothetical protein
VKHVILVIFQKDYLSCIWKQNINKLWFIRWVGVVVVLKLIQGV